ncbi:MAG TPA: MFS transporter, partial [Acidobacteriota bacterium]|nr:MFS transporter [Acidobacteriota bacterium]
PASSSLIGDLYQPHARARAMSVFMVGLPLGVALSYAVGGMVAQHYGWRPAFFVAGVPGLVLGVLCLFMREPQRGGAEILGVGAARRPGSPYLLVLAIPTMGWIIISGALHNFNLYALSFFLPAFLIRYHRVSVEAAGFISAVVIGTVGAAGMLLGGWLGDLWARRRPDGRMLLACITLLASAPAVYVAISRQPGALASFMVFQALASLLMYVYYANVYSTIHDVVEPVLRGTAMALYFLAMYTLGASLGPLGTGWLSDRLARKAALGAGYPLAHGTMVPDQFRAIGLQQAMYVIPAICVLLALVLFAGAVTVRKDVERLRDWMRHVSGKCHP